MPNHTGLWESLQRETGPIIVHVVAVFVLEAAVLLIGLLTLLLERFFPEHGQHFSWIKTVDIWIALALSCKDNLA